MLDIKRIRKEPQAVQQALANRSPSLSVDAILALDEQRRQLLQEEEALRNERNVLSKQVGECKRTGQDATDVLERSKTVAERIKGIETAKDSLEAEQTAQLLLLPNLPSPATPVGQTEADNVLVREWGQCFLHRYTDNPVPHYELGPQLGWLDFERGVRVAQSRFTVFRDFGARLERALIQLMLDVHTHQNGYSEISPPLLVNEACMQGTGQLPKFAEDMFRLADDPLYLIPTAEVPVTNLYREELLNEADLPMAFVAYTPCFRREAGSAGRDTRGLIRQHQFDKVELVHVVHPDQSETTHQALVRHAETLLQMLELPYRVVELCTGDLGFSAQRCYDLEVWMPAQGQYREISSCSNMGDFQARRMNCRFREAASGKPQFCHTLNGSGLAVGRTLAALLEHGWNEAHQTLTLPGILQPYLQTPAFAMPNRSLPPYVQFQAATLAIQPSCTPALQQQ